MKNYISRKSLFYYDNINNYIDKIVLYNISYDKRRLKKYIRKYLSYEYHTKLTCNSLKEPFFVRNPYALFYPKIGKHLSPNDDFMYVICIETNKKEIVPIFYSHNNCIDNKINIDPILIDKK